MSEPLYPYYERELLFVRQQAQEFARQYPAAAGRLLLEPNRSLDPHIERLIQAFALIAGRVHHKLDDDFPELTDALLGILYPHYLAPVPSMAVAQFVPDPARTSLAKGFVIPKHSQLRTRPIADQVCKYQTNYPVTLWPVAVTSARLQPPPFPAELRPPLAAASALRIQLECQAGARFSQLALETLRFHLLGEGHTVGPLYELLFNHVVQVVYRPLDEPAVKPIVLTPTEALAQVGFERGEGMFPYPPQSFPGYRLLTELFAFPAKFLFADLKNLDRACRAGFGKKLEVVLYLRRPSQASLEQAIDANTFRLGCSPIINLLEQTAEPIALTRSRFEYRVVPDVAQPLGLEVHTINSVTSVDPAAGVTTEYQPFYSFQHGSSREDRRTFWYATRRPATQEGDRGSDVYLNLVDLDFKPQQPSASTLVVRTMCTNRDRAGALQRVGDQLHLELEGAAPLAALRCVRSVTLPLRPARRRASQWRLVSHLALNHLSIAQGDSGRLAFQEILRLYDFSSPQTGQQQAEVNRLLIEGVLGVSSRRVVGRTGTGAASGFCRGVEVTVELDEEKYVGTGAFLFACVLERFLGLYASLNSFSQLVAKTRQSEELLKKWPPRAGEQPLL